MNIMPRRSEKILSSPFFAFLVALNEFFLIPLPFQIDYWTQVCNAGLMFHPLLRIGEKPHFDNTKIAPNRELNHRHITIHNVCVSIPPGHWRSALIVLTEILLRYWQRCWGKIAKIMSSCSGSHGPPIFKANPFVIPEASNSKRK